QHNAARRVEWIGCPLDADQAAETILLHIVGQVAPRFAEKVAHRPFVAGWGVGFDQGFEVLLQIKQHSLLYKCVSPPFLIYVCAEASSISTLSAFTSSGVAVSVSVGKNGIVVEVGCS